MAAVHPSPSQMALSLRPIHERSYSYQTPLPLAFRKAVAGPAHRHIWVVAGTSCCGKSTIAAALAEALGGARFIEGDDVHTQANRDKMRQGIPLTDADRAPWLAKLKDMATTHLLQSTSSKPSSNNVVVTCSALRHVYRDFLRTAELEHGSIRVHFLFLSAPASVLVARAAQREGHYFTGERMVQSQISTLEMPDEYERAADVVVVDCTMTAWEVKQFTISRVNRILRDDSTDRVDLRA